MSPTYTVRFRVRADGGRGLRIAGVLFLVAAASLWALSTVAAPTLESLQRDRGIVGDVRYHNSSKGAPYLTISIGGLTYTTRSYDRAWLDSLRATLQRGDTATVWGKEVPNGWYQIWQLQKGDSMVIRYADRVAIEHRRDDGTRVAAAVMAAIGIVMLGVSAMIPRGPTLSVPDGGGERLGS